MRHKATLLLVAGAVGAAASSATAHVPVLLPGGGRGPVPTVIDGRQHVVFYGALGRRGSAAYRVRMPPDERFTAQLLVPNLPPERRLATRRLPRVRITAPGRAPVLLRPTTRVVFDEPFTGTSYLSLGTYDAPAVAGTYALEVRTRIAARFVVATGSAEGPSAQVAHGRCMTIEALRRWYATPATVLVREQRGLEAPQGVATCLLTGGQAEPDPA